MNDQIRNLCHRADKQEKLVIGLMSGTSMDGLDIALCTLEGHGTSTKIKVLEFLTAEYEDDFRKKIKAVFSKRDVDLQLVCLMNELIGNVHGQLINQTLQAWGYKNDEIDFVASHGQTIFHAPKSLHKLNDYPNGTLQIGDGDHIAVKTGIITISDFRQKHLAAGGEGAPLAVYGDYFMFSKIGEDRIMLNIGGIANFTFLPGSLDPSSIFSSDVAPGNTLMDQYMQKYFNKFYDKDGLVASSGNLNEALLVALFEHPFFALSLPKTTGPELFNLDYLHHAQERSFTSTISKEDVVATLCHFSAAAIANAINQCFDNRSKFTVFISGGGMHNPLMVKLLKEKMPNASLETTEMLGIQPDAKEAVLFAVLANQTISGERVIFGKQVPPVFMGKISLPE